MPKLAAGQMTATSTSIVNQHQGDVVQDDSEVSSLFTDLYADIRKSATLVSVEFDSDNESDEPVQRPITSSLTDSDDEPESGKPQHNLEKHLSPSRTVNPFAYIDKEDVSKELPEHDFEAEDFETTFRQEMERADKILEDEEKARTASSIEEHAKDPVKSIVGAIPRSIPLDAKTQTYEAMMPNSVPSSHYLAHVDLGLLDRLLAKLKDPEGRAGLSLQNSSSPKASLVEDVSLNSQSALLKCFLTTAAQTAAAKSVQETSAEQSSQAAAMDEEDDDVSLWHEQRRILRSAKYSARDPQTIPLQLDSTTKAVRSPSSRATHLTTEPGLSIAAAATPRARGGPGPLAAGGESWHLSIGGGSAALGEGVTVKQTINKVDAATPATTVALQTCSTKRRKRRKQRYHQSHLDELDDDDATSDISNFSLASPAIIRQRLLSIQDFHILARGPERVKLSRQPTALFMQEVRKALEAKACARNTENLRLRILFHTVVTFSTPCLGLPPPGWKENGGKRWTI